MAEVMKFNLDQMTPEQHKMLDESMAWTSNYLDAGIAQVAESLTRDRLAGISENASIGSCAAMIQRNLLQSEVSVAFGAQLLAIAMVRLAKVEMAKSAQAEPESDGATSFSA